MRAHVWAYVTTGWGCLLVQHSLSAAVPIPGDTGPVQHYSAVRTLHSNTQDFTKVDDEEPEKINLIIVPLMAFAAFMIFLCMRCCHWNQKDFRDRGIIIEHHHTRKKHIAQGLMHTRFDGQSQRRLSCVPEQLMLLPLFLTGSARSELNKMVDPPQDGIMEKICESDCDSHQDNDCDSEPPSTDSEFDTPFPYQSPGRRRSSSVPPDILLTRGRFKKSRSSSIVDIGYRGRRLSVTSAISSRSSPQTVNAPNQPNYNPNLLSVTAELHEAPRSLSQDIIHSGDVTPESVVYPLPGEAPRFSSDIRITRDVSVETTFREVSVDTRDLYLTPSVRLPHLDHGCSIVQHRKFARLRRSKPEPSLVPSRRKRRRCDDDDFADGMNTFAPRHVYSPLNYDDRMPDVHSSAKTVNNNQNDRVKEPVQLHDDAGGMNNLTMDSRDIKPFIEFDPFEAAGTNGVSPNSSGNSFSNCSDHVSTILPPSCLSPISCNSEFYRRLCSSEDSALAKSPISEFSTDDRSNRDPLSRDSTVSPPTIGQRPLDGRLFTHSRPHNNNNNNNNMQSVVDDVGDAIQNHVGLNRVDSGKYSDTSTGSSKYRSPRADSAGAGTELSFQPDRSAPALTQPLLSLTQH